MGGRYFDTPKQVLDRWIGGNDHWFPAGHEGRGGPREIRPPTVVSSGALDGVVSRLMSSEDARSVLTLLPRRRQINVHSKIGRGSTRVADPTKYQWPSGSIVTSIPARRNLTAHYIFEENQTSSVSTTRFITKCFKLT
ncbi:uncharacterized protein LOC105423715 [Pogonomyrmex barbatus]|uniref:Uncharacterized protein LOC105423715 n=1 Tax=Pogonomyrmex barbatus TaxID=144034 RepID=A0A6I9WJG2_9HYME|nr:uncharacterized protein LOC105423715 [Pogonomyrmex barbatus]